MDGVTAIETRTAPGVAVDCRVSAAGGLESAAPATVRVEFRAPWALGVNIIAAEARQTSSDDRWNFTLICIFPANLNLAVARPMAPRDRGRQISCAR